MGTAGWKSWSVSCKFLAIDHYTEGNIQHDNTCFLMKLVLKVWWACQKFPTLKWISENGNTLTRKNKNVQGTYKTAQWMKKLIWKKAFGCRRTKTFSHCKTPSWDGCATLDALRGNWTILMETERFKVTELLCFYSHWFKWETKDSRLAKSHFSQAKAPKSTCIKSAIIPTFRILSNVIIFQLFLIFLGDFENISCVMRDGLLLKMELQS